MHMSCAALPGDVISHIAAHGVALALERGAPDDGHESLSNMRLLCADAASQLLPLMAALHPVVDMHLALVGRHGASRGSKRRISESLSRNVVEAWWIELPLGDAVECLLSDSRAAEFYADDVLSKYLHDVPLYMLHADRRDEFRDTWRACAIACVRAHVASVLETVLGWSES